MGEEKRELQEMHFLFFTAKKGVGMESGWRVLFLESLLAGNPCWAVTLRT